MAKNIFLQHTTSPLPYASQGGDGGPKYPTRNNPDAHARFISRKLQESRAQDLTQRQVAAIRYKDGLYLEFSGAVQHDLAVQKLENLKKESAFQKRKRDGDIVRATVYIPAGQETYFLEKVQAYGLPVGDEETPKNNDLVMSKCAAMTRKIKEMGVAEAVVGSWILRIEMWDLSIQTLSEPAR